MEEFEKFKSICGDLTRPLLANSPFLPYQRDSLIAKLPNKLSIPYQYETFVERMLTYKACYWSQYPGAAVALARHGFKNNNETGAICCSCQVSIDPSAWLSEPDFLSTMAHRAHHKGCSWKIIQTPREYLDMPRSSMQAFRSLQTIWLDLLEMDADLPLINKTTLNNMEISEQCVEELLDSFGRPVTERERNALILGICGWVKNSKDSVACKFCCRVGGTWNYYSVGDEKADERNVPPLVRSSNIAKVLFRKVETEINIIPEIQKDENSVPLLPPSSNNLVPNPLYNGDNGEHAQSRITNSEYEILNRSRVKAMKMINKKKEELIKKNELALNRLRSKESANTIPKTERKFKNSNEKACEGVPPSSKKQHAEAKSYYKTDGFHTDCNTAGFCNDGGNGPVIVSVLGNEPSGDASVQSKDIMCNNRNNSREEIPPKIALMHSDGYPRLVYIRSVKEKSPPSIVSVRSAREESPPRIVSVRSAREESPPKIVSVRSAREESPPRIVSVRSAREESPPRIVSVKSAREESLPRILSVRSAKEESPPRIVSVKSAREESPPRIVNVRSAREESPPRIVSVRSASEESPPRIVSVRSAWDESPPRIVSVRSAWDESPPRIVSVRSAWDESPPRIVSVRSAREESPPRIVSVKSAREESPPKIVSVSSAWDESPPKIVSVRSAWDKSPPRIVSVRSAREESPPRIVRVRSAREESPPRIVSVCSTPGQSLSETLQSECKGDIPGNVGCVTALNDQAITLNTASSLRTAVQKKVNLPKESDAAKTCVRVGQNHPGWKATIKRGNINSGSDEDVSICTSLPECANTNAGDSVVLKMNECTLGSPSKCKTRPAGTADEKTPLQHFTRASKTSLAKKCEKTDSMLSGAAIQTDADVVIMRECNGTSNNCSYVEMNGFKPFPIVINEVTSMDSKTWNNWNMSVGDILPAENPVSQNSEVGSLVHFNGKEESEEMEWTTPKNRENMLLEQKNADEKQIYKKKRNLVLCKEIVSTESCSNGVIDEEENHKISSDDVDDESVEEVRTSTVNRFHPKFKGEGQLKRSGLENAFEGVLEDTNIRYNTADMVEKENNGAVAGTSLKEVAAKEVSLAAAILLDENTQETSRGNFVSSIELIGTPSVEASVQCSVPEDGLCSENYNVCNRQTNAQECDKRKFVGDSDDESAAPKKKCAWDHLEKSFFHPELDHRFWCIWRMERDKKKGWKCFLESAIQGRREVLEPVQWDFTSAAMKRAGSTIEQM